jgi:hypothetical protein
MLDVPSEIAHIGGSVGGHDHVVAVPGGDLREVGVDGDIAVHYAKDPSRRHGDHQERAVRQPAQARRLLCAQVQDGLAFPESRYRVHAALVEVAVPEAPVVPAGPLTEVEAIDQQFKFRHDDLRGVHRRRRVAAAGHLCAPPTIRPVQVFGEGGPRGGRPV